MMELLYRDKSILICVKPAGVLSTDEPGGVPELARRALGESRADVRTVHRLDRVVGGLMVLALGPDAAGELSRQIREGEFQKEYLAAVHGRCPERGSFRDLMFRDKARKMSFVTDTPGKGVQEALLDYETVASTAELSLVRVQLLTGRTHQIRCQFAAHGYPLAGERKYDTREDPWPLALWSRRLAFHHPESGEELEFTLDPPKQEPWTRFEGACLTSVNLRSCKAEEARL